MTTSNPSSPSPCPSLSCSPSTGKEKENRSDLARYIKRLKRSPESPSRLTLPPITAVAVTLNDPPSHPHYQTKSNSNSNSDWEREWDWEEVCQIGQGQGQRGGGGLDWSERLQRYGYNYDRIEIEHVEDTSLEQDRDLDLPPVDPFSPPPASPKLVQLSPLIPSNPLLGYDDDYDNTYDYDDGDNDSHEERQGEVSGLQLDFETEPETIISITPVDIDIDNDSDSESNKVTPELESKPVNGSSICTGTVSRRRRTTLSEVEDYRKYALWKNAFQTALALEIGRAETERQGSRGLWSDVDVDVDQDDIGCQGQGPFPIAKGIDANSSFVITSETTPKKSISEEEEVSPRIPLLPTSTFTAWQSDTNSDVPGTSPQLVNMIDYQGPSRNPAPASSSSSPLTDNQDEDGDFDKENSSIPLTGFDPSRWGESKSMIDVDEEGQLPQDQDQNENGGDHRVSLLTRRPLVELGTTRNGTVHQSGTGTSEEDEGEDVDMGGEAEGEEGGSPELQLLITPCTPCAPLSTNSLPLPLVCTSATPLPYEDARDQRVGVVDEQVQIDCYSTVGLGLGLAL